MNKKLTESKSEKSKETRSEKSKLIGKKAIVLISSGIDSPVAAWKMKQNGLELVGIHFSNEPFTDHSPEDKTIKLCEILGIKKLYVIKHGYIVQGELMRNCTNRLRCILCRRMMFKISEQIAEKENAAYLVTGENLGQVASQTLSNMTTADKAIKTPILRPLLCYDKIEIINIAKKIGTYNTSIEASMCCNAVPKDPATKSRPEMIDAEEKKFNVTSVIEKAVKEAKIINLG